MTFLNLVAAYMELVTYIFRSTYEDVYFGVERMTRCGLGRKTHEIYHASYHIFL